MEAKRIQWIIKGMQRDVSVSKFSPSHAYEAFNIRFTANEKGTLMSVTNEKGNKAQVINNEPDKTDIINSTLVGNYMGHAIMNNILVIFTVDGGTSYIYRFIYADASFTGSIIYQGDLGFDTQHPIETIAQYENENIQKVYWADGINQPRVINVAPTAPSVLGKAVTYFDFAPVIELEENILVRKNYAAAGNFAPGVIQYAFSYFNKYGQETSIFNTTPLQYLAFKDRGGSPEDKISISFDIVLQNPDRSFDYVRIYSIHRTSIDSTPTVLKVADVAISETGDIVYSDNGTEGSIIDPSILFYIGAEYLVAGTMAHKDGTLFLGNIKLKKEVIPETVRDKIENTSAYFRNSLLPLKIANNFSGDYPYENQLSRSTVSYGLEVGGETVVTFEEQGSITTFKYLETYRMGVQFQHKTGKWSEPVWVNDVMNDVSPGTINGNSFTNNNIYPTEGTYTITDSAAINELMQLGYVRVRPVVCFPKLSERSVMAQGIIVPTVYNVGDRASNSPFVQSSWFARPNLAFDYSSYLNQEYGELKGDSLVHLNSPGGIWVNDVITAGGTELDPVSMGAWAEFRHNNPIPPNYQRNAEIQCIEMDTLFSTSPYWKPSATYPTKNEYVINNQEYFFIDQSIVTFHSPDIEFDDRIQNLDASNLKLRIVGQVPLTGTMSNIDIISTTPPLPYYTETSQVNSPRGFYKKQLGVKNISLQGHRSLISGPFWFDEISNRREDDYNTNTREVAFMVYPWQRNGSLNNAGVPTEGDTRPSVLDKKKMSNLRFSPNSVYYQYNSNPALDKIWYAHVNGDTTKTGISGVTIFNSDQPTLLKIPAPVNSSLSNLNYYANVDKVINVTKSSKTMSFYVESVGMLTFPSTRTNGYGIYSTGSFNVDDPDTLFKKPISNVRSYPSGELQDDVAYSTVVNSTDPVRIKYKSPIHAVIALNYTADGKQRILPTITSATMAGGINYMGQTPTDEEVSAFWEGGTAQVSQDAIPSALIDYDYNDGIGYGFFWLAELYNDNVQNRFGGQSSEAFENNQWYPAGKAEKLNYESSTTVIYNQGDTFYQRYDNLKTYPFTLEDQNSIVEIVSFMCETRVNIDGRYDRNRGQIDNLVMTPNNFNKINLAYSQSNNFFNYRGLNYDRLSLNEFPNSITWSKNKQAGELTDTWTNITMASVMDLDGDKGDIIALRRFMNEIFAFQNNGISRILFNSRVQIPASDGVPIEIANNYRVDGKRYVSETIGCQNKWSIVSTPEGLYFMDNYSHSIQLLRGENLENVSDTFGFRTFLKDTSSLDIWNSYDFNNFIGYYNQNSRDLYYINKDYCLGYSELLKQFTSFYSYNRVPLMFNINDKHFAFKNGKIWEQGAGHYNLFFGEIKPFYITLIANPDMPEDKIFSTVNYRADTYHDCTYLPNITFDKFSIWNEYQSNYIDLTNTLGKPSNLKKKFRSWNITIPRDKANGRDRIRNPWTFIKLEMSKPSIYRTELHDVILNYFV